MHIVKNIRWTQEQADRKQEEGLQGVKVTGLQGIPA